MIPLIYDFDGTLTPEAMQEYTVLPRLGIDPRESWQEVGEATRAQQVDEILTYMRLKVEERREHLSRDDMNNDSNKTQFLFRMNKGVETAGPPDQVDGRRYDCPRPTGKGCPRFSAETLTRS